MGMLDLPSTASHSLGADLTTKPGSTDQGETWKFRSALANNIRTYLIALGQAVGLGDGSTPGSLEARLGPVTGALAGSAFARILALENERVAGPASATDRSIATYSGTTGKVLRDNPNATVDASGYIRGARVGAGVAPTAALHAHSGAVTTTSILRLANNAGDVEAFVVSDTPEGSITGSPGDFAFDYVNGRAYVKATGVATNTGWREFVQNDPVAARAYALAAQSIPTGVATICNLDTSAIVLGPSGQAPTVNLANDRIIINRAGTYRISWSGTLNTTTATVISAGLFVNGTEVFTAFASTVAGGVATPARSEIRTLSANDYVQVSMYQNTGSTINTQPYGAIERTAPSVSVELLR